MVWNQQETGVYYATIDAPASRGKKTKKIIRLEYGSVKIETDEEKIKLIKESTNWSVVKCSWPEVRSVINNTNAVMKTFLIKNVRVKEFHPMIETFTSGNPGKKCKRLKVCLTKKDDNFF